MPHKIACIFLRDSMKVVVPKESLDGENRVALVPEAVKKLVEAGLEVVVESGAGEAAGHTDGEYEEAGATVAEGGPGLYKSADVVLKVQAPRKEELDWIGEGTVLIGLLRPLVDSELIKDLAERGITGFAMESIPRVTRAQPMDALSSQSTVAGYRSALVGAQALGKFYPLLTTAAGTVRPARVLILGAGVAGLQAIATARRLGAEVEAFDTRPVVKEQVESLGAKFVELEMEHADAEGEGGYAKELSAEQQELERKLVAERIEAADVVITTALVPGKPAPLLIKEDVVKRMKPGSVIVDLAAETGGNCELTEPGQDVVKHGVKIIGPLNLPSTMPTHASQLYARNVSALLLEMVEEGQLKLDLEDEVVGGACITHAGEIVNAAARAAVGVAGGPADA